MTYALGVQVRLGRVAARFSQRALAEAAGLGQQRLSRIELGRARLTPAELEALARALAALPGARHPALRVSEG